MSAGKLFIVILSLSTFLHHAYGKQEDLMGVSLDELLDDKYEEQLMGIGLDELLHMDFSVLDTDFTVFTADRTEKRLSEVSESVWVLTRDDIRRSAASNVGDLLRLIPGVAVVQITATQYEITMRDHDPYLSNYILVLIDGRPTSMSFSGSTNITSLPLVMESIERVEVLLGPGSTLYGSSAMRGIVNIITKQADTDKLSIQASAGAQWNEQGQSFDNVDVGAYWSQNYETIGYNLAASFQRFQTWNDGTYPGGNSAYEPMLQLAFTGLLNYKINASSTVTLRAGYSDVAGDTILFSRQKNQMHHYYADVEYNHQHLLFNTDTFNARVYYRGNQLGTSVVIEPLINIDDVSIKEDTVTLHANYRFTLLEQLTTTVGLEGDFHKFSSELMSSDNDTLQYVSSYLQEQWQVAPWLRLTAGVRLHGQMLGETTRFIYIPKASLYIKPAKYHTIRASVGKAFRSPSLLEMFAALPATSSLMLVQGNYDLNETQTTSVEVGYQYTIPRLLTVKLDLFYMKQGDRIDAIATEQVSSMLQYVNLDDSIELMGGEVGVIATPFKWMRCQVGYSLTYDSDYAFNDISEIPHHKFYVSLYTDPVKNLEIDMNFYSTSSYYFNVAQVSTEQFYLNPMDVLNISIRYWLTEKLALALVTRNVLGVKWADYYDPQGIDAQSMLPGAERIGRQAMLQLRFQM